MINPEPTEPKRSASNKGIQDSSIKIIISFFIGAIVTYGVFFFGLPLIISHIESIAIAFTICVFILGIIFLLVIRYKEWLFFKIFGTSHSDFTELGETAQNLLLNFQNKEWSESKTNISKLVSSFSSWYAWFSFRNWTIRVFYTLFLALGGLLGTLLLFNQNKIMSNQNKLVEIQNQLSIKQNQLFELQNYKIDTQNYLIKNQNLLVLSQNELLMSQNQKIDFQNKLVEMQGNSLLAQNKLLEIQNEKITQDLYLEEASRRSSLIVFLTDVLNRMEEELRAPNNTERELSNNLILRINDLSIALKPYRYLEDGKIIDNQISPERGQLFFALLESNLSKKTYSQIFKKSNFSYSELKNANLEKAYINGANLQFSNLRNCKMDSCEFYDANLKGVLMDSSSISNSTFSLCDFTNANLKKSQISDCKFYHCALSSVNFDFANIQRSVINSLQSYEIAINLIIKKHLNSDSITYRKYGTINKFNLFLQKESTLFSWQGNEYFYLTQQIVGKNPVIKANKFYIGRDGVSCSFRNSHINTVELNNLKLINCNFDKTTFINTKFVNVFFDRNKITSIFVDTKTVADEFDKEYLPGKKFIDHFIQFDKTKSNEDYFKPWEYIKIKIKELIPKK